MSVSACPFRSAQTTIDNRNARLSRVFARAALIVAQVAVSFVPLIMARLIAIEAPRLTTALIGPFAALAGVITAAGLRSVIAFSVNQRRQEFGCCSTSRISTLTYGVVAVAFIAVALVGVCAPRAPRSRGGPMVALRGE